MNKMWSGAPQWASWALQPQHYQNMKPEEASTVDWAELAKQWIQMKETTTSSHEPVEPTQSTTDLSSSPPQAVAAPTEDHYNATAGGGEMDMEIEDDKGPSANGAEQHNGETWEGWSGDGSWQPNQGSAMGWGWGWPVESYGGNEAGGGQEAAASQQYNIKDVSQAGYAAAVYGNEFSAGHGIALQVCIGGSTSSPALLLLLVYFSSLIYLHYKS